MSDNYMPGSMAGSGIYDEHDRRCATNCEYPLLPRDEEGIDLECANGHAFHECNCDDLANDEDEYL